MNATAETNNKGKFLIVPLLVLMCAQIGTSGDNSILSVATNELIVKLNATVNDIQLANMVYSLCAGAFMIAGGMLGIIIGWNKNFKIGAFLAVLGELAVAFAPNIFIFTWGGRLLVGLGASLMIPSVLGLIPSIYKGKDRAVAFGAIGAATGIASALGPIVAGLLIDNFGYKVAFTALAGYFILILIASTKIPDVGKTSEKLRFDTVGVILAAVGLFLFLIGISKVPSWGLIAPVLAPFTILGISPALPLALMGLVVLAFLLQYEKKREAKTGFVLIPQSFLKNAQVRNGLYASAAVFLYLGGIIMIVNPNLQIVGGYNALQTGLTMVFLGLPLFLASLLVPKYFFSVHPKVILRLGYILLALAIVPFWLSLVPTGLNSWFYLGMVLAGTGQGLVSSQASNVVSLAINERDAQQSGGIQATARNVGQAIGVAVLGMVMLYSITASWSNSVKSSDVLSEPAQERLSKEYLQFMSDKDVQARFAEFELTAEEMSEVVDINAQIRIQSSRNALVAMGIMSLFFLFGTRGITQTMPGVQSKKKETV